MKLHQLRQIIREEIKHVIKQSGTVSEEYGSNIKATIWSKWPNSKTGDVFLSKRQGVLAVRVGDVLRPLQYEGHPYVISNRNAFATDKQFSKQIKPTAKAIADEFYEMWGGGLNTPENVAEFGKRAETEIKKLK